MRGTGKPLAFAFLGKRDTLWTWRHKRSRRLWPRWGVAGSRKRLVEDRREYHTNFDGDFDNGGYLRWREDYEPAQFGIIDDKDAR